MDLYVSDLDGTLLNSNQKISEETINILNNLIDKGLNFSIATARSITSASRIIEPLNLKLPIVLHNGVFIYDPIKKENILSNYVEQKAALEMIEICEKYGLSPIVFTTNLNDGDKIFYKGIFNEGEEDFISSRLSNGDKRFNLVDSFPDFQDDCIIAIIIIEQDERLSPLYKSLSEKYEMVYHYTQDIYSKFYWLEVTSKGANKKEAVKYLKEYLGAEKLICFGDNLNDYPMFEIADEKYAVSNGHHILKENATKIIGSNDEHSVAAFINSTWKAG
ncbi:MAG: HAD family hydrolase [Bacillota bacterium]|nr:HAD family hydrolase [Bacillota bacterium]